MSHSELQLIDVGAGELPADVAKVTGWKVDRSIRIGTSTTGITAIIPQVGA